MNRDIVDLAGSLALSELAELHVVSAWDTLGEGLLRSSVVASPEDEVATYVEHAGQHHAARLADLMRELTGLLGREAMDYLKPHVHLVKGWARREIPGLAERLSVDLMVMGTVARTGVRGFIMGNTAESILQQAKCSVLAIKPQGFTTPVALGDAG